MKRIDELIQSIIQSQMANDHEQCGYSSCHVDRRVPVLSLDHCISIFLPSNTYLNNFSDPIQKFPFNNMGRMLTKRLEISLFLTKYRGCSSILYCL